MLMCEFFFANQLSQLFWNFLKNGFSKTKTPFQTKTIFFLNLCVFSENINVMKKKDLQETGVLHQNGMLASRGFLMSWG